MRLKISIFFIFVCLKFYCQTTTFQKVYGTAFVDYAYKVLEDKNGDYVVAGSTQGFGTDQAFIMSIDCQGNINWNRLLHENLAHAGDATDAAQTVDGGYVVTGATQTYGGAAKENRAFLLKLDQMHNLQWFTTLTSVPGEYQWANDVLETSDGGFAVTGWKRSPTGDTDLILFKTDKNGNLLWSKVISGGAKQEQGNSLIEQPNGDIIAVGSTSSFGAGSTNVLVVKSDKNGNILWIHSFGAATATSKLEDVENTNDGGYVATGSIRPAGAFVLEYYVMKFDAGDNIQWSKSYKYTASTLNEMSNAIIQTSDNGYAFIGQDDNGIFNASDASLLKIDSNGNLLWSWVYGGANTNTEWFQSLIQTNDNGFFIGGYSLGLGSGGIGTANIYLVKTDSKGSSGCNEKPFALNTTVVSPQLVVGGNNNNYQTALYPVPVIDNNLMGKTVLCQKLIQSPLNITTTGPATICPGDSTKLAATPGSSFLWNTGATTQTITVKPSSTTTYTVSVSYSKCYLTATATVTVTVSPSIIAITSYTAATCGNSNGTASVTANGGTGPFNYTWSNGTTGQTATNLSATTYTVTVTDAGGCTASTTVNITSSSSLTGQFTKGTDSCPGCGCKEWIMITASGGTSPYTYIWPGGYSGRYKSHICPGDYAINIKDKNGCSININLTAP